MTNNTIVADRKYCLEYNRISTEDQNPQSCDDQSTVNKRHIGTMQKELAPNGSYRDEGFPGSSLDRPGLQDLLIRCQTDPSIYAVVISESDRIARGNLTYITIRESLKKYGVKIVSVTQPMIDDSDEGELIGEIFGAVNGFISKISRRKSMRATDEKAARGVYPSWAPLGYKNINLGTEEAPNRIIEVDEDKAPYVRRIPKLYNDGLSYEEMSNRFYGEGLRGKNGGKVSAEEIRSIIFSDFYLGDFYWRGKKFHGKHTPLFTNYLEVQRARTRSHEKGHVHTTLGLKDKLLLKKLPMFCYDCKTIHITAECKTKHYQKRDAEYILFHCAKSLPGGWKNCPQPTINKAALIMEFAEKAVRPIDLGEDLAEFLFEEMNREYAQQKEQRESLLQSMNRRLGQIDTELKNLFEMRVSGQISEIDGKSSQQVYEEYKTKKEFEKKSILEAKTKVDLNSMEWKLKASNFFSDCSNAVDKFLAADEEKQYLFLRRITSNVFLNNKQLIVTHQTPFCYLLKTDDYPSGLQNRNLNITAKLAKIIKVFEDFKLMQDLRMEIDRVKPCLLPIGQIA